MLDGCREDDLVLEATDLIMIMIRLDYTDLDYDEKTFEPLLIR